MPDIEDGPSPQWLVQEPEGPLAPKTPGRWRAMWTSDSVRLEEAHGRGDAEVLVYGRKYVVDMKARTVQALYLKEKPETRPVVRATYFVKQGGFWTPYSEKDAANLELFYASAKMELRSEGVEQSEVPLSDGENKVVMKRALKGMGSFNHQELEIACTQEPRKAPSIIAATFTKTSFEVCRGTANMSSSSGIPATEGDIPLEQEPPKHLVFVVHGVGESVWSRHDSAYGSLRDTCSNIRRMSAAFLKGKQQDDKLKLAAAIGQAKQAKRAKEASDAKEAEEAKEAQRDAKEGLTDTVQSGADIADPELDEGELQEKPGEVLEDLEEEAAERDVELEEGGDVIKDDAKDDAGYVEVLPVEWFEKVHGDDSLAHGLVYDITLDTIPVFRDFANQVFMDIMYYLTPDIQTEILTIVASEMNRMWSAFKKYTPDFKGKVSILGHSLGSVIAHDVLMAQPPRGDEEPAVSPSGDEIPTLSFDPHLYVCCGSPLGMFLSLRPNVLDKESLFNFKTTKHFFNLFHVHDPVAYRLEPLLDPRLKDLAPEIVPHKGGDRVHIKVRKVSQEVNVALERVQKTAAVSLSRIQEGLSTTLKSVTGTPTKIEEEGTPYEEVEDVRQTLKERIDWALQETSFEAGQPWASAIYAHSSYFQNVDTLMFLVNAMNGDKPP